MSASARRGAEALRACGRGGSERVRAAAARTSGQAAVELVALLPLLVAIALGILQALAAGLASELAGHAAQSGAVAVAEGRDGDVAARSALPGWARSRVSVDVRGSRVRVRVTPPALLPGVGERLAATATADAGSAG